MLAERLKNIILGDPKNEEGRWMDYFYYDKDALKHLSGANFNFGIPGAKLLSKLGPKELALLAILAGGIYLSRLPSPGESGARVITGSEPTRTPPLSLDGEATFVPPIATATATGFGSDGWDCRTITGPGGPTPNAFRAALQAGDPNKVEPPKYRVNGVVRDTLPTTSTNPPEYVHPGDEVCVQVGP